ncbi:hypothetical protein BGZ74_005623, partial [Mortierella antarctica]
MDDLSAIYKELLVSNEGDILVKLNDGKQLKIISFLIKKHSPVFKTMLESSIQEAATGMVDLSSQYSLEAFHEVMAYIYYNNDCIIKLITDVPICLVIASEALKHKALADEIYASCLEFLVTAIKPQRR